MYKEIYDFGIKNNLVPKKNKALKYIAAYINLDENGQYLGLEIKDKKDKEKSLCPDIGSLAFGNKCNPIVEKFIYIIDEKQKKYNDFRTITKLCSNNVPKTLPIYLFLKQFDENEDIRKVVVNELNHLKANSFISFKINGEKIEESNCWEDWFNNYMDLFNTKVDNKIKKEISIITGKEIVPIVGNSPIIKSSATGTGVYIISFGNNSFESYGLKGNENASISEDEANVIKATLEYLLSGDNYNNNFGLIHWYKNENNDIINDFLFGEEFDSYFNIIEDNASNEALKDDLLNKMYNSIFSGNKITNNDLKYNTYFICKFNLPTKGRFFLSNQKEGNVDDLFNNLSEWYKDTLITYSKYNVDSKEFIIRHSIITNIYSIFFELMSYEGNDNKFEAINNEFGDDRLKLLLSIIDNKQIPFKFYKKALDKIRKNIYKKDEKGKSKVPFQIIKVYLIRKQKMKGEISIMDKLNPNEKSIGYNCGRMFATYECIQQKALGDNINASIVDKFYNSAMTTPAYVFGRLARLSTSHMNKLDNGLKIYYSKKLQEISTNIKSFPKTLNVIEQGMFVLGYYQQKQDFFTKKNEQEDINIEEKGDKDYE